MANEQLLAQLREALRLATILGFEDDVEHWKNEIAKAEGRADAVQE